jgi:hypothetical protein
MARCIIHAGTHKTGTTTLQSIFSKKRDILKGLNYYYPILDKKGKCHNKLAHHLATCNNQDLLNIRRTLAGCVNSIDDSRDCLFLSAEEFSTRICTPVPWQGFEVAYYDSRRLYLERLLQVLADFERVDTFICFREHEEYAHSLYATKLLSGQIQCSFQEFVTRCAPIFDYQGQLSAFENFSPVHVKRYEDIKDDLEAKFLSWLEIPLRSVKTARLKQTPPIELIYWLSQGVQDGIDDLERKLRAVFCRSLSLENLDVNYSAESLWESEGQRERFLRSCTSVGEGMSTTKRLNVCHDALQVNLKKIDAMYLEWRKKPKFKFWPFRISR